MGMQWKIYPEHRFGVARLSGDVDGDELLAAVMCFFEDPDWKPGFRLLWDSRGLTSLSVSPSELTEINTYVKSVRDKIVRGKAASVIANDIYFWLGKLILLMSDLDEEQVQLFRRMQPALEWLGVSQELAHEAVPESGQVLL